MFGDRAVEDSVIGIEVDGVICGRQFIVSQGKNRLNVAIFCEADYTGCRREVGQKTVYDEGGGIPGSEHKWGSAPY